MNIYEILTEMGYQVSYKDTKIEGEEGIFFSAENDGENYCIHQINEDEFSVTSSKWMVMPEDIGLDVESTYDDERGVLQDFDSNFFIYDINTDEEARLSLEKFIQVMEINCVI